LKLVYKIQRPLYPVVFLVVPMVFSVMSWVLAASEKSTKWFTNGDEDEWVVAVISKEGLETSDRFLWSKIKPVDNF